MISTIRCYDNVLGLLGLLLIACGCVVCPVGDEEVEGVVDVARVWSGHPVGFCLLTRPPYQFVGFYDANRRMTVASRKLDEPGWRFVGLRERLRWDSHNYIAMAVDDDGYLHLSGNMHVDRLKYYRTDRPLDIATFERVESMVGRDEERVTYPEFFRGPNNELIFTYRDGSSGSGSQVYNVYDHATRTWRRLIDGPLVDGRGKMNAYFYGPKRGPDGRYHLCWVWRDTPDCATNHDLSYARSSDLVRWETSRGEPLTLPVTFDTAEVVDPVPAGGGIINGNAKIGFDAQNRPVIAYHKFDENGVTQLYNARLEDGAWKVYQSSDWDYRWEFKGGGSIHFEVRVQPVRVERDGTLVQGWHHDRYGTQLWRLDPETLRPVERLELPEPSVPASLMAVRSEFPGMGVRVRNDSGTSGEPGVRYVLRWETLGPNRDRPRKKPWPEPSVLQVHRVEE